MPISPTKYLVSISLMLLVLTGCYSSRYDKIDSYSFSKQAPVVFPFENMEKALYRANISIYGYEIDGLLMIKKDLYTGYKVSLFNQLGMSFFDADLIPAEMNHQLFLAHNMNDILDHKQVRAFFEKTFSLLFAKNIDPIASKKYFDPASGILYLKAKSYKGQDYFGWSPAEEKISRIASSWGMGGKEKISIDLIYPLASSLPDSINIMQHHFPLEMQLSLIKTP